ncbi:RNA-directed DNA polymerase-like protein [Gossypium australe]|uniref:RNA-directed DNA polymerase-like protein n=1 Tax=Gossypium australe TaxID=47621 RepID=A0A5B6V8K9_9ROSI|nr:RNA-directed DNA polymerase-like protein [Gossypium australe]
MFLPSPQQTCRVCGTPSNCAQVERTPEGEASKVKENKVHGTSSGSGETKVMVKKANDKWKMCIDFTNLNKVCPKYSFPLPSIDQLVDASIGHMFMNFMDAFLVYNQNLLDRCDKKKTTFITEKGLFCYWVMLFGLKNVGATYQRLVNRIFKNQIGRGLEVYVDDMLVKTESMSEHVEAYQRHLQS